MIAAQTARSQGPLRSSRHSCDERIGGEISRRRSGMQSALSQRTYDRVAEWAGRAGTLDTRRRRSVKDRTGLLSGCRGRLGSLWRLGCRRGLLRWCSLWRTCRLGGRGKIFAGQVGQVAVLTFGLRVGVGAAVETNWVSIP